MKTISLVKAITLCQNDSDLERFLADLCTPQEMSNLQERWRVAQLVHKGFPYREISEVTGASTTTITRVARAIAHGQGGYKTILNHC